MGEKEVGKDTRMTLKCGALDLTGERESRTLKILSLFKKILGWYGAEIWITSTNI